MGDFFTPERFPGCKPNLHTAASCVPRQQIMGTVTLSESTLLFADNDLGTGKGVRIQRVVGDNIEFDEWVTLTWLDWNKFEYVSVF